MVATARAHPEHGWAGVDPGTAVVRVATAFPGAETWVRAVPAEGADEVARTRAAVSQIAGSTTLVVAVPDAWSERGTAGVLRRERLRAALRAGPGGDTLQLVESSVAVLAGSAGSVDPGRYLVCDVGASAVTMAWCALGDDRRTVRLLASRTATLPVTAGVPAFDRALVDALPRATGAGPLDVAHALGRHARRAALALPAAATRARYRQTPVYRVGGAWLDAGTVLDAFGPVAAAVREVAEIADGAPGPVPVLLTGGFAAFARTVPTVVVAMDGRTDTSRITVLEPTGAARGAAAIAGGEVVVEGSGRSAALLVDRVVNGLLEQGELDLAGEPEVEVADLGGDLLRARVGGRVHTARPEGDRATPGHYRAAHWANRGDGGAVVLRPVGGGAASVYGIPESTAAEGWAAG